MQVNSNKIIELLKYLLSIFYIYIKAREEHQNRGRAPSAGQAPSSSGSCELQTESIAA